MELAVRVAGCKNRFTRIPIRKWEERHGWRVVTARTAGVTAQTNWMLKIQFEGFAVRFIRSLRSLQAGPLTRSMETQLFSRKCLSARGRHLFDYGNVW